MPRKKKDKEEVPGTGVDPDVVVEETEPETKTTLPEQGISSSPIFLSAFLEEHNSFRTNMYMGPAFRAWCRLKDPALLEKRRSEKEWLTLFDEFIRREVK